MRTLASELLAAVCVLSPGAGRRAVLAALSDYCVAYEESFRLEGLIGSLRLPEIATDSDSESLLGFGNEEEGVWEARTATMCLINALANCSDSLEDRVMFREELGRRGLNEVIVVSEKFSMDLQIIPQHNSRPCGILSRQNRCSPS